MSGYKSVEIGFRAKRFFYTWFIVGSFFLFPFQVEAINWNLFGKKKPATLSEELNDSELTIKSYIKPFDNYPFGDIPDTSIINGLFPPAEEAKAEYAVAYTSSNKQSKKMRVTLIFKTSNSLGQGNSYQHWIYWDSDVENPDPMMNEETVKAIFDKVYETAYGRTLGWVVERKVIPNLLSYARDNNLTYFDINDAFDFNALLFRGKRGEVREDKQEELRRLIAQTVQSSDQGEVSVSKTAESILPNPNMTSLMERIVFGSYSAEEFKSIPAEKIKKLVAWEILSLLNTPEKIKAMDMNSIASDIVVRLLTNNRTWREAITPDQLKQLDVRTHGIQYVFAPAFKEFVRVSGSEVISIDGLSDEQIMSMDRDTFLRDIFLAGDLYVEGGYLSPSIETFMTDRQKKVKEKGHEAVMQGSLSEEEYNTISDSMGFDEDFKNMTAQQRRELFKKQIAMMTDFIQQIKIISDLVFNKDGSMTIQKRQELSQIEMMINARKGVKDAYGQCSESLFTEE